MVSICKTLLTLLILFPLSLSSDSVRPPIPPVRQVLVEDGFHNHRPRNHTHSVFDGFRNLRAETSMYFFMTLIAMDSLFPTHTVFIFICFTGWLEEGESATSSTNHNKRRTLEELFRPPLDLMFRGPMDQVQLIYNLFNIEYILEFPGYSPNSKLFCIPTHRFQHLKITSKLETKPLNIIFYHLSTVETCTTNLTVYHI